MQLPLFTLLFCNAALAIPVSSGRDVTSEALEGLVTRSDDVSTLLSRADELYEDQYHEENYDDYPDYDFSPFETGEDPAFAHIFDRIEGVLDSEASTKVQLERILDAIIHYDEDVLESVYQERLSSNHVTAGVQSSPNDDEMNAAEGDVASEDAAEAVLGRIEDAVYEDESLQKRIHLMLNEFAEYLHAGEPKDSSVPQDLFFFEDARFAADVEEDVEGDLYGMGDGEDLEDAR